MSDAKYVVTITKVETESYTAKNWVKLFDYTKAEEAELRVSDREQYGYRETPATREVEAKIYSQEVDDLDIAEVIKAVNGMGRIQ